jgi:hypothetical protein
MEMVVVLVVVVLVVAVVDIRERVSSFVHYTRVEGQSVSMAIILCNLFLLDSTSDTCGKNADSINRPVDPCNTPCPSWSPPTTFLILNRL